MSGSEGTYHNRILGLVEPVVESAGMEVVDVECRRGRSRWMVRVYIDKEGGVTLDDCAMISGEVGDLLDVHEIPPGPYNLEISSPGLDRPLVRDRDFIRYKGHTIKIRVADKIEGKRNLTGRLIDFVGNEGEENLVIEVHGKQYTVPRSMVVKANLTYEF
jgi:ribosome maturation factor RimP